LQIINIGKRRNWASRAITSTATTDAGTKTPKGRAISPEA